MCVDILKSETGPKYLTDDEIILLIKAHKIASYKMEDILGDFERSVRIRRKLLISNAKLWDALDNLPFQGYDYSKVNLNFFSIINLIYFFEIL